MQITHGTVHSCGKSVKMREKILVGTGYVVIVASVAFQKNRSDDRCLRFSQRESFNEFETVICEQYTSCLKWGPHYTMVKWSLNV